MNITITKLCTDDMLIFDKQNYESYIVKPPKPIKPCKSNQELLTFAKELVATGHGVHLNRAHLNQVQQATSSIFLLS